MSFLVADLLMGKLPHACPATRKGPLNQQHPILAAHDDRYLLNYDFGRRWPLAGNLVLETLAASHAALFQWAIVAARLCRRTNQSAQFHERLIEIAGSACWK